MLTQMGYFSHLLKIWKLRTQEADNFVLKYSRGTGGHPYPPGFCYQPEEQLDTTFTFHPCRYARHLIS